MDSLLAVSEQTLSQVAGIRVPWEKRQNFGFYLAAPDFDYVDVTEIDRLEGALTYHNFAAIRPVREFGQLDQSSSEADRVETFGKDRSAIDESAGLIAVTIANDPGTLLELGYAAARSKPTAVYDPFGVANNLWLSLLPNHVSRNVDETITWAFAVASSILSR
jgi:nucleoside 2-deoxyribosyltransferase